MDSIQLRQSTIADFPHFYPIFKLSLETLFPEYTKATKAYFSTVRFKKPVIRKSLKEESKLLFLALNKEKIVGFLLVNKVDVGVSMAVWLAVLPEYQGHGIASGLITLWEKKVKQDGAHALQVWTQEKNISFYEKCGFTLVGLFPKAWYGIDINLLYKPIQSPKEKHYLKNT